MNGKPDSPIVVAALDYREVARPLTFRAIKEDLDAIYTIGAPEPKKLIMWEHQMDWLVKAERKGEPLEDLNRSPLGDLINARHGLLWATRVPRPAIWGIPVEYHRPLLERQVHDDIVSIQKNFTIDDPELRNAYGSGRLKHDA